MDTESLRIFTEFVSICRQEIESGAEPSFRKQNADGEYYCGAMNTISVKDFLHTGGEKCPYMNLEDNIRGDYGNYCPNCNYKAKADFSDDEIANHSV